VELNSNTLCEIADFSCFEKLFAAYTHEIYQSTLLFPRLSKRRLFDAHFAWRDDLSRVQDREPNLDHGLDHFKQCGHLSYWLRRTGPVVEYDDLIAQRECGEVIYDDERRARELILSYGSEFIAFDFGFRLCYYSESERTDRKESMRELNLPKHYILDICHMLKFKNFSPHCLFLICK
jgi:hypothetical protein